MTKLAGIAEELKEMWSTHTRKELCEYFHICDNTLWRYQRILNLPNKKRGRPEEKIEYL